MIEMKDSYQLLDSGNFRKLEQVGPFRLDRPALQAIWQPIQPPSIWQQVDAVYERSTSGGGQWQRKQPLPDSWQITYGGLTLKIQLTDFGHLGLFPEQGENWAWMQGLIHRAGRPISVLNTFGYTGGSSLAAAARGARVVHVDASRGVVGWGKENVQLSSLSDKPIRWLVDDVSKFITREQRRGNRYDAIILDPPSFGRGPKGEVWKFERDLPPLLEACRSILSPDPLFVLLSAHTPGFAPLALEYLLADMMRGQKGHLSSRDMITPASGSIRPLPSGIMARWERR